MITTVVSREFARIYVKNIRNGQPDIPLAPEEIEAVDQARARGNAPFTVRPRIGPDAGDGSEEAFAAQQEEDNARLPCVPSNARTAAASARDCRLLSDSSSVPSTLGWPKIEPAIPWTPRNLDRHPTGACASPAKTKESGRECTGTVRNVLKRAAVLAAVSCPVGPRPP